MKKGWRNDPHWVAHYAARDKARIEREIERMKVDINLRQLQNDVKASLRRMMNNEMA